MENYLVGQGLQKNTSEYRRRMAEIQDVFSDSDASSGGTSYSAGMDMSIWAVLNNYDMIRVTPNYGANGEHYYVVLNRGILQVARKRA
jgi:hypothetical protein